MGACFTFYGLRYCKHNGPKKFGPKHFYFIRKLNKGFRVSSLLNRLLQKKKKKSETKCFMNYFIK